MRKVTEYLFKMGDVRRAYLNGADAEAMAAATDAVDALWETMTQDQRDHVRYLTDFAFKFANGGQTMRGTSH